MADKTEHMISPDLNSLVVTSRYKIPMIDLDEIKKEIQTALPNWQDRSPKGTAEFFCLIFTPWEQKEIKELRRTDVRKAHDKEIELMDKKLLGMRRGVPFEFRVLPEQHLPDGIIAKIECIPTMYWRITKGAELEYPEQYVQEAQIECVRLVERIMKGVLRSQEITPPTVGPFVKRTEIKNKLLNLGLNKAVDDLDAAEQHIIQHKFPDALGRCRSALDVTVSWALSKCGLEETDKFSHNVDRLRAKGFLDTDTAEVIRKCFDYLAHVGVPHEKGAKPGLLEANLALEATLTMLNYLTNRFG